jgi:serine/threonine-protein kinase
VSRRCPRCGVVYPDEIAFCGNDGNVTIEVQAPGEEDRRLGTTFGGYIVAARVADGAMGRVYEGRHAESRDRVAIKVLHEDVARDPIAVERFKREFETAKELDHPNIVKVIELGETGDGSWFLTMEYLEGEELGQLLRREGAIPKHRFLRILSQLALALDHAHGWGVIHRDLKPDNVFLCRSANGDDVRVLDFGSVKLQMETGPKLTAFGTTLGSPYYMSPEQAMGKLDVDQRTDIFAVAAILFETVTGRIAFEGSTVAEILMKIVNGTAPMIAEVKQGVPPALDDVVQKGTRKDKNERYGTCSELVQAALRVYGITASVEEVAHMPEATFADLLARASGAPPPVHVRPAGMSQPHAPPSPPGSINPRLATGPSLAPHPPKQAGGIPLGLVVGLAIALVGVLVLGGAVVVVLLTQ